MERIRSGYHRPPSVVPATERRFIGTAAAIGIALATAGTKAATDVYQTHVASKQNERAQTLEAQQAAADRELQREQDAAKQRAFKDAQDADQRRWDDYIRMNEPAWRASAGVLSSLYDMAGMRNGPQPGMPTAGSPPPPGGAGPMATSAPMAGGGQRAAMPTMPLTVQSRMPSLADIAMMAGRNGRSPAFSGDAFAPSNSSVNV